MRRSYLLMFLFLVPCLAFAQANFSTSLHATRAGKPYWYNSSNGGFEQFTNISMNQLACRQCHGPTNADGQPYPANYTPGCVDCHPSNSGFNPDSISVSQCYSCHGRQKRAAIELGYPDVHRSRNMRCWDCHTSNDMHGTSTVYSSMLQTGAVEVRCEDCHIAGTPTLPNHASWDPPAHNNKISCAACHERTTISCYNCHFESYTQGGSLRRAQTTLRGFTMLANRTKDGKVYPMSFQSLTYQGNAFAAFGPSTTHTITDSGRVCTDCHLNFGGNIPTIQQYNTTGQIRFATWNPADSTLSWLRGIVPIPLDYRQKFKMDFITYTGNPNDPVVPSKKWTYIGKNTWDGHQMLFATPLTKVQMKKLGFDTSATLSAGSGGKIPSQFSLEQNYPNPFNPSTTIEFSLPTSQDVTLKVFNLVGQEVRTLILDQRMEAGVHQVSVKMDNLPSGVYLYKLTTNRFSEVRKMLLLR